jgi:hypothetical protein
MRIAIASSGLGHVARGIETWAEDTALAIRKLGMRNEAEEGEEHPTFNIQHSTSNGRRGMGVMEGEMDREGGTRSSECGMRNAELGRREGQEARGKGARPAGDGPQTTDYGLQTTDCGMRSNDGLREAEGSSQCSVFGVQLEVTLFAAGKVERAVAGRCTLTTDHCSLSTPLQLVVLPCMRRSSRLARFLARVSPGFAWRWGLKSAYGWEQFTFWRRLEPELRRGGFDILHVQDPMLAYWCRRARLAGRLKTQEILAHGTEERAEFLSQFECVQHLTPWHLEQSEKGRKNMESRGE